MTKSLLSFCLVLSTALSVRLAPAQTPTGESKESYAVKIEFNRRVPMRDGVELSADLYRPEAEGRFSVILLRTPYNKTAASTLKIGRYFASHGYVFVAMDVRGRGDSDGKFVPYRNEGLDGYDSIEWCARQPWSDGKVGTYGGSYLGRVQWLAALQQPPHLTTMVAMVTPSDPFVEWPTGLPLPMDISWQHFTAGRVSQNMEAVDWPKIHLHLPLLTMDEAAGRPNPYWKEMIEHSRLDEWREAYRYQNKYERVQAPVLHISGWYDDEQIGTPLNFMGMRTRGATERIRRSQKLVMGWWPHNVMMEGAKLGEVDFGASAAMDLQGYILRWFDHWLKGKDDGIMREPPARLFLMGANRWKDEDEWPIARTRWTKFHLHSGGRANSLYGDGTLSVVEPASEPPDGYTHDPARPVPFITEPSFAQIGGPDDYRPVERRDDVLVYTSETVKEDMEVCGPVKVRLYASTSARDTDFMAKLVDVWPNGFAQRLADGMVRARFREGMERPALIAPGRTYPYDVDLWNTCQVFLAGHSIRLEIASSAFPKYDRNPGTGEALGKTTRLERAEQRVYHEPERPSHIVLPVIPATP